MESSSAKVGDLTKAFFYGTLKQNEPNEQHLEHQNCQFICEAITVEKWPLTIGTDFNIPLMLNKKGFGNNVHGEVYLIDNKAREFLDEFEGVNEGLFSPFIIEVKDKNIGEIHQCISYLIDNFKPEILNNKTILFEKYSSKNEFFPEYKKSDDIPSNSNRNSVYGAIKNIPV